MTNTNCICKTLLTIITCRKHNIPSLHYFRTIFHPNSPKRAIIQLTDHDLNYYNNIIPIYNIVNCELSERCNHKSAWTRYSTNGNNQIQLKLIKYNTIN